MLKADDREALPDVGAVGAS